MRSALPALALGLGIFLNANVSAADEAPRLPQTSEGWKAELVAAAPQILYPTAIAVAPDGTIYLGQDPMDMPGPPTVPADSIVAIKDGRIRIFAEKLWAVMGLEWVDGTLYVVHAPFLSALRDADGDGRADQRIDLITGLGPAQPAFNGINDHIASGIRLGMDGFLYISFGDKGIPRAVGKDGTMITQKGGGVLRIRPDGTGLEVVSTGERNPLSAALTATDEIFTYGNDDDSKKWPNSLTHHIVGGYYGYPYDFLAAPQRCLPIVGGKIGGSGTQGICYNEDGLPERYRGNFFFCDWGLQTVFRYEVERAQGTFKLKTVEPFVTKGGLNDFRPFSLASSPDGGSVYLVDWGFDGWLTDGPKTGRLFRLSYNGPDRPVPTPRPSGNSIAARIKALDHPTHAVRLESQRTLARLGRAVEGALVVRLRVAQPTTGRLHALWALDAMNTPSARVAVRAALNDPDPELRLQAARSAGIRRDREAARALQFLLRDREAPVRREAAIALGKLGDPSAGPSLMAALADPDIFTAWSIRRAIRALAAWDETELVKALLDPERRDAAILLTDEAWAVPVVNALRTALEQTRESELRGRIVANLAGLYRQYPAWTGQWFGTNPLAGDLPQKTENWDPGAMRAVLAGLARGLTDPESAVRREAIAGLLNAGNSAAALFRARLNAETEPINQAAIAQALGNLGDADSVPLLAALVNDAVRPLEVRAAALDALAPFRDRTAMMVRLSVVYDKNAAPDLVARALLAVGTAGMIPPHDVVDFLNHQAPRVRVAALWTLASFPGLPAELRPAVIRRLDDPAEEVRKAAISAAANLKLREAIPKLIEMAGSSHRTEATLALCALPDPRALPVYLDALKSRDVNMRHSAETAMLPIRDLVAGSLESKLRAGAIPPPALEAVERVLTRFQPISDWRVIGPFPRTTAAVFFGERSIDFSLIHTGASGVPVRWQPLKADATTGRVSLDDLKAGSGDHGGFGYDATSSPDLAAFAYGEIVSNDDRPAMLLIGSSGAITVTVNEHVVCDLTNSGRPYAADSDRIRVTLKQGSNRILVRSRQGIGKWSFSVQVSDPPINQLATKPDAIHPDAVEMLKAYALGHEGNATRGATLFFDPRGIGCIKCHSAAGHGNATIGPDLSGLAFKYDKPELIRSVVEPSSRIATGYQPVLLAFTNGLVVTGIVRAETASTMDLIDADGKLTRVLKSEIIEKRTSDVSLMPTGLIDTLSGADFADLIAFLQSLREPAQTAQAEKLDRSAAAKAKR
jgi:putative heme-binding domain-containing protein